MLEQITPVILTLNEELNIRRVVDRLSWAQTVIVVDSYSSDNTVEILSKFRNIKLFQRAFDTHSNQWNYAITETGISTEWILALDADYVLTEEFVNELARLIPGGNLSGFSADFNYCIFGKPLRGSLYPPVTVLFRKKNGHYIQDGHTQRICLSGNVDKLQSPILHDDRKPLSAWLNAQERYMELEAEIISKSSLVKLRSVDKIRKLIFVAPVLTFFYCLFVKRGLLDGKAGLYYALQRTIAEFVLSLKLIELRFTKSE